MSFGRIISTSSRMLEYRPSPCMVLAKCIEIQGFYIMSELLNESEGSGELNRHYTNPLN
jgi:hypothetical protein